jgi:hypothetical protein
MSKINDIRVLNCHYPLLFIEICHVSLSNMKHFITKKVPIHD